MLETKVVQNGYDYTILYKTFHKKLLVISLIGTLYILLLFYFIPIEGNWSSSLYGLSSCQCLRIIGKFFNDRSLVPMNINLFIEFSVICIIRSVIRKIFTAFQHDWRIKNYGTGNELSMYLTISKSCFCYQKYKIYYLRVFYYYSVSMYNVYVYRVPAFIYFSNCYVTKRNKHLR